MQASLFGWRQAWILPSNSDAMRVFEPGGGEGEQVSDAVRTLVLTMPQLLPPNERCEGTKACTPSEVHAPQEELTASCEYCVPVFRDGRNVTVTR